MKKLISILIFIILFSTNSFGQSTSPIGIKLIKSFEGCHLKAYKCPAGVWTNGYGNTFGVLPGMIITQEKAEADLIRNLRKFERNLNNRLNRILIWHELDALISFTYNLGSGVIKGDLQANINRGSPDVPDQLKQYNKARNPKTKKLVELRGLTRRRNVEARLYASGKFG
jgi:lysozyme